MPGDKGRRDQGGAASGDDRGPGRQASARNQHQKSPPDTPGGTAHPAAAKLDVLQGDDNALLDVPAKIASMLSGADQAMKHEIPACRRRHLSSAPGYPAAAAATTRGERVGSGEGERRRKPGEPDTNETA